MRINPFWGSIREYVSITEYYREYKKDADDLVDRGLCLAYSDTLPFPYPQRHEEVTRFRPAARYFEGAKHPTRKASGPKPLNAFRKVRKNDFDGDPIICL